MPLKLLQVGIGLAMMYLLLSMLVTGVMELWAALWDKRSRVLADGMKAMLGAAANAVYEHGLVKSLKIGRGLPSYIPSGTFTLALLDLVAPGAKTPEEVLRAIDTSATPVDAKVKEAMRALVNAAGGEMERLRKNVEGWFNAAMDRVSGTYRRSTQWGLLITSLALAGALNVDTIRIANTLLNDEVLRTATVAMVEQTMQDPEFKKAVESAGQSRLDPAVPEGAPAPAGDAAPAPSKEEAKAAEDAKEKAEEEAKQRAEAAQAQIQKSLSAVWELGMPIGWGSASSRQYLRDHPQLSLLGLLVTALAIAQGAPFWFDLLSRFVGIRSTVKPRAKKDDEDQENIAKN